MSESQASQVRDKSDLPQASDFALSDLPPPASDSDERFVDGFKLNIHRDDYVQDIADWWERARDSGCPVAHTTDYGVGWVPVTWEAISEVVYNTEVFSSRDIGVAPRPVNQELLGAPPITSDPPFHTDARRLLLPFFSQKAMQPMTDITRDIAHERLAAVEEALAASDDNVCDVAEEYVKHIPVRAIASILGLPREDDAQFTEWVLGVLQTSVEELDKRLEASFALRDYFIDLIDKRRVERGDDLPSKLLDMTLPNGEQMTDGIIVGVCFLLLVAGIDTTQGTLAAVLHHLATNPEDRQRLVDDPELIPTAIEEILRAFAPVTMARVAAKDGEISGCPVHEGEKVYLPFGAGNRDPEKFDRPDEVLIDRAQNRHAAFGLGIHRCLGSNLARLELKVAVEEWLKRYPKFELATDYEHGGVLWRGMQVRGARNLFLRIG